LNPIQLPGQSLENRLIRKKTSLSFTPVTCSLGKFVSKRCPQRLAGPRGCGVAVGSAKHVGLFTVRESMPNSTAMTHGTVWLIRWCWTVRRQSSHGDHRAPRFGGRLLHAAGFDGPRVAFAQLWPTPHRAAHGSWLIPANHQSIAATGINSLTSLFTQSDRHEEDETGR
jgi:hypothetical protein